jgi:hypothetical protein
VIQQYRFVAVLLLALGACQSPRPVSDYEYFYERQPRTILVLPVVNETTSAEAPAAFASTIASPLIQRGYIVLPVLPSVDLLRSEGIYTGEQLSSASLGAFRELLGADAALQTTLHSWDTVYLLFVSGVEVHMTYRLYDTETGEVLWEDTGVQSVQSDSSGHPIAALINAAVTALSVQYVDLARKANMHSLQSLPAGPLDEQFEIEREKYLAAEARRKEREAAKEQ